jgi:IS4 transposase
MVRVASLFSQVLTLFPRTEFQQAVKQHRAERYAKGFSCWSQFVAMLFCQLAQARSLREISQGLSCCLGKLRHLGLDTAPSRSTLSYANEHRPWQLYESVFGQLLDRCYSAARGRKRFRFRNRLMSLDSTTIDLCLSLFDWARFIKAKGAIKIHLLLDHEGYLPTYAVITDGRVNDVRVAQSLEFPPDTVLVVDRGYLDYALYARWTEQGVWFVTRHRSNADYRVIERREVPARGGVVADEIIELASDHGRARCPHRLRRIEFHDAQTDKDLVFLTNHMGFAASTIARIYKDRWQIELFFKALKQYLKIKTFVGTSPNAVRTQIWTALIAMLLLRYLQLCSRFGWSLSNLIALLRWNLFTYRDLWSWIHDPLQTPPLEPPPSQLSFDLG